MSKYEELKYVLSGATDWDYEYAKKEDVEAAFAELEERHAMELDQWVLELGKIKPENERLKKLLFNAQKAASDAKLSAHEKSRRIDELKTENENLKYSVATLDTDLAMMKRWRKFSEEKPEHHQWILVFYPNHSQFTTGIELRRWDEGCKFDVEAQEIYEKWMPLPKAPKEA